MNVLEALDKAAEIHDRHLAAGVRLRELEHRLWRATLPPDYIPLNPNYKVERLMLSKEQIHQLRADIWQTQLEIYNLAVRAHELRFGKDGVPQWLIDERKAHRANILR